MKKIITLILIFTCTIGFAQDKIKDKKDEILTAVTNEVCSCINAKDVSGLSEKELEVKLGLCILQGYSKNKKAIDKNFDISFSDENSMEKFGEDIGIKMVEICPETLLVIAQDYIIDDEEVEETLVQGSEALVSQMSGKVLKINAGQFNIIEVKDNNKRLHKLLWLEYFSGQELLSDIKSLKKKDVKVIYATKEMYDPKLEDYRTYKVIQGIEVQ